MVSKGVLCLQAHEYHLWSCSHQKLLGEHGILRKIQLSLSPQLCEEVELHRVDPSGILDDQRETMFASRAKIEPSDLPTATQIFTPKWIAQYMVENTIGRLWMLNTPHSSLSQKMPFYIKPQDNEEDFLSISSPTELTVCDPACGSGHLLTCAFDLLFSIYEEEGWKSEDIPSAILTHNLHGIELDERVADLAHFCSDDESTEPAPSFNPKDTPLNVCP